MHIVKDFSEDYILSRIIEISEKLNYKVKPDYIIFKTKDFDKNEEIYI